MSSSTITIAGRRTLSWARVADFVELTKPRIASLVLVSVAVSAYVARWGRLEVWTLLSTLLGTLLVAASASAMNQWIERASDGRMPRTADRPIPAGRLGTAEVLGFSALTLLLGSFWLLVSVNWLTCLMGLLTWILYVCVYTPLKSHTAMNTAVGAVSGAMPVLIGWSASGAQFDLRAAGVFMIVFLWQFPHFMAIAWMYREQYERGGMKMLSVVDPTGRRAGMQAVLAALALLPVSLIPGLLAPSASLYLVAVLLLGAAQLLCAARFLHRLDQDSARLLLRASLIYLPALLGFLLLIPSI